MPNRCVFDRRARAGQVGVMMRRETNAVIKRLNVEEEGLSEGAVSNKLYGGVQSPESWTCEHVGVPVSDLIDKYVENPFLRGGRNAMAK